MFLQVTRSFYPFRIRRHLIFELICESAKMYAFQKSKISLLGCLLMFYFASIQTPLQLPPLTMSSLKNTCFQNMCAETTLEESAISLVLVILCVPISVEAECRNFSALEVQCVYRWQ